MKQRHKIFLLLTGIATICFSGSIQAAGKADAPILILGTQDHFAGYTGEILKAEGFNEFRLQPVTAVDFSLEYLKRFDIIILTAISLTGQQENSLLAYVKAGGNLIAFRPGNRLTSVFGITGATGTANTGYIAIDTSTLIGKGLLPQTLQIHTVSDLCQVNGCKTIASFYNDEKTLANFPAVVMNYYGAGHAVAFMYNLPQSIAFTRQGNPLLAGQEKDGIKGLRAMDMFTNGWVDTSKNRLNHADEQMRLLSHCIELLSSYRKPLPRLWYFPDTLNCLVTLTNDGEFRNEKDFEPQFSDIETKGANMALYILKTDQVSKSSTDAWIKRGNEISGHPDDTKETEHPAWSDMTNAIETKARELNNRFGITQMRTIVNHWFVWCGVNAENKMDFTAQAKIEAANKIEMDINYAHYDNNSNQQHFLGAMGLEQGNFNGTGLPMKFVDEDGRLVNIYQLLNNVYDQQYMEHKDSVGFYECFKGLMDRSINKEVYSYITIKAHNDEYFFSKKPLSQMLEYAKAKSIPVWTPVRLLDFITAKNDAGFSALRWSDNKLSFQLKSELACNDKLSIMLPSLYNGKKLKAVTVDGVNCKFFIKQVKGFDYAFLTVTPGNTYSMVANYTN